MIKVFISYRRDGICRHEGEMNVRSIKLYFDAVHKKNIRMFYDIESMHAGKFNQQIYSEIRKCDCIVLVLPKGAFDRCGAENDWVRQEIRMGLRYGKPFIPVTLEGFEWPENLPDDIKEVKNYQGLPLYNPYFNDCMDKLARRIHESVHKEYRTSGWIKYLPAVSLSLVILLFGGIMLHRYITGLPASGSSPELPDPTVSDTAADTEDSDGPAQSLGKWEPLLTIYGLCDEVGRYSWYGKLNNTDSLLSRISSFNHPSVEKTYQGPSKDNTLTPLGTSLASDDTTIFLDAEFVDGTFATGYLFISSEDSSKAASDKWGSTTLPSVYIEEEENTVYCTIYSSENVLLFKYQPGFSNYGKSNIYQPSLDTSKELYSKIHINSDYLTRGEVLVTYAMTDTGNYIIHLYRVPTGFHEPR